MRRGVRRHLCERIPLRDPYCNSEPNAHPKPDAHPDRADRDPYPESDRDPNGDEHGWTE